MESVHNVMNNGSGDSKEALRFGATQSWVQVFSSDRYARQFLVV